ncbi:MAG: class I SAM-dependent methyltransferase [Hyphomicrobiaceae bacterium]
MSDAAAGDGANADRPLAWVCQHLPLVPPGGRVLDVACGGGRHLRAALAAGHPVTGVDRDLAGTHDLESRTGVRLVAADLENGDAPPFAGDRFAGVIVSNYLWRPLLAAIVAAVADDGVLIYETFAVGNARFGRPSRDEFLLRPGELIDAVAGRLVVLAYRHGEVAAPRRAVRQSIAAVGPRHPVVEWGDHHR